MRALSIRQPYAELILRGIKTVEYRSRPTRIIDERFWIYASKGAAVLPVWSNDLDVAAPPAWMLELAKQVGLIRVDAELPRGVIVGSAVIDRVETISGVDGSPDTFGWHLADIRRETTLRKPDRHPQPAWFYPFAA